MLEKLPLKENLANLLIDTLYIGKEAIYRRLRGEVPFTLEEAALISRKLGVSLDNVIGVCFSSNAVFDLNVVDHEDPFEIQNRMSDIRFIMSVSFKCLFLFVYIYI